MKFHTKFDPPIVDGLLVESPSTVQAQFADACQTDNILKKYSALGMNPFAQPGVGEYLDCTQCVDLRTSLQMKQVVDEYFQALPAEIRLRYRNDSMVFSEAVLNNTDDDFLREQGILPPIVETPKIEGLPEEVLDSTPPEASASGNGSGTPDSVGV